MRPLLLELLESRFRAEGVLRIATDIADYARHAQGVLEARPGWAGGPCPRPSWRPQTLYESKGLLEGRDIHDLHYTWRAGDVG